MLAGLTQQGLHVGCAECAGSITHAPKPTTNGNFFRRIWERTGEGVFAGGPSPRRARTSSHPLRHSHLTPQEAIWVDVSKAGLVGTIKPRADRGGAGTALEDNNVFTVQPNVYFEGQDPTQDSASVYASGGWAGGCVAWRLCGACRHGSGVRRMAPVRCLLRADVAVGCIFAVRQRRLDRLNPCCSVAAPRWSPNLLRYGALVAVQAWTPAAAWRITPPPWAWACWQRALWAWRALQSPSTTR